MTTSVPADAALGGRARTWIAVLLLGLVAAALVWFLWKPQWRMWCHGADRKEYREKLRAEQDPALVEVMTEVLRDERQPDTVRLALAALLLEKNRVGTIEAALRDPRLDLRILALRALAGQTYFKPQYADDPAWQIGETFQAWISDRTSKSRVAALMVMPRVYPRRQDTPPAVVAAVRDMARPKGQGAAEVEVRVAAADRLAAWGECAAAGDVLALAQEETESLPRHRLLGLVLQMRDGGDPACVAAIPEEAVRGLIARALAHPGEGDVNRTVRMGGMIALLRHPEWTSEHLERLRAIAGGQAHEAERRLALEALAAAGDPATLETFARWFHDPSPSLRSSAAAVASNAKGPLDAKAYEACLVGFLARETSPTVEFKWRLTMAELRQRAGRWVGLPPPWDTKEGDPALVDAPLKALFAGGAFEGLTRAQVAEAWFRWLGERRGLKGPELDAAVAARAAFWAAAEAGNVAGAKAALAGQGGGAGDLWTYERGWLLAHGA